jgi:hypothetical protein
MVHAPIGGGLSLPVPLGIVSIDKPVVQRVQDYLASNLPRVPDVSGKVPIADVRSFLEEGLQKTAPLTGLADEPGAAP